MLLAALAVTTTAKAAASQCCQVCGAAVTRGSRAQELAALGQCPEDQLCLKCLALQMTERVPECARCSAPFILDERAAHAVSVPKGGAMLIRTLLLRASSKSSRLLDRLEARASVCQIRVAITHWIGSSGHPALHVLTCRTACTRNTVGMLRRTPGCTELAVATNPSWVHDARAQPHQTLTIKTSQGRRLRCSVFHIGPLLPL